MCASLEVRRTGLPSVQADNPDTTSSGPLPGGWGGEREAQDCFIPFPDGETEEWEELNKDEAMSSLQS